MCWLLLQSLHLLLEWSCEFLVNPERGGQGWLVPLERAALHLYCDTGSQHDDVSSSSRRCRPRPVPALLLSANDLGMYQFQGLEDTSESAEDRAQAKVCIGN